MDNETIISHLKSIFEEVMDVPASEIKQDTFVIRELEAESIDLLELAVDISSTFSIEVEDDQIFLSHLRAQISEIAPENKISKLTQCYPHLSQDRLAQILTDLKEGPVLKIKDLIAYIEDNQNESI